MALANFFSKNALAAAQVMAGMTPEKLALILEQERVAIAFDARAATSAEGRTTVQLAVNLAARLYPSLSILLLGAENPALTQLSSEMADLARGINPLIELGGEASEASVVVVVGDTPLEAHRKAPHLVVYSGSRNWDALISTRTPVGCGSSNNPFGAAASACIAMANVFRHVFSTYLETPEPDSEFSLSLFDYTLTRAAGDNGAEGSHGPELGNYRVDLGDTILGGVGAIGNAVIWTLARLPGLSGILHLVDHENVGLTNLQRYILTNQRHLEANTAKVDVATAVMRLASLIRNESALQVVPHRVSWAEYLRERDDFVIERVATAFDTKEARLAVQAALPRLILNAWTQQGDLGVSRHLAFGVTPCVACIYHPRIGGKSDAELVAEAMVVPEPAHSIRELIHSGMAVGEDFIRGVAQRRGITDPEKLQLLLRFSTQSLREFYQEVFCGGLMLQLTGGTNPGTRVEAPIAFQSALAGVMLAAEIVIDAGRLRSVDADAAPARTVIDLLRPVSVYPAIVSRRQDGHCLCEDKDYLDAYVSKYGLAAR